MFAGVEECSEDFRDAGRNIDLVGVVSSADSRGVWVPQASLAY